MSTENQFPVEHSWIEARINRAYQRMLEAKTECWADRWAAAFIASNSAHQAMAAVAKVRATERRCRHG